VVVVTKEGILTRERKKSNELLKTLKESHRFTVLLGLLDVGIVPRLYFTDEGHERLEIVAALDYPFVTTIRLIDQEDTKEV
jgi:hypothetical protein